MLNLAFDVATTTVSSNSSDLNVQDLVQRFTIYDYIVFISMLTISSSIGIYYGIKDRNSETANELLLGGRSMNVIPVGLSVLSSFISAITLLGTPAEIYQYGTMYVLIIVAYIGIIPAAAYLYLPVFYRMRITSVFEYLSRRFNRVIKNVCSILFCIQMIVYMSIVLYAPSLALAQVTGLNVWVSVVSIGLVCTFYTTIGGIKAVIGTDVFQIGIMFTAMLAVTFKGAHDIGGWKHVWKTSVEGERIEFNNFNFDPTVRVTFWATLIGGYFTWLAVYGVNQAMVQRYMTVGTLEGAQKAVWINLPGLSLLVIICSAAGLVIYTKYHDCDPKMAGLVKHNDQLLPLFVMDTLGFLPGLPGLFVAGIFSGALSTVSSGMNSLAAVTLEDLFKTYITPDIDEASSGRLSRILAICFGILCIGGVGVAQNFGEVLQAALSVFGIIGAPILGIFTLGLFFPWANKWGAGVGFVSGLATSSWIVIGKFVYKPRFPIAPLTVEGCPGNISILLTNATKGPEPYIFPLYRVSFLHFGTVGCLVTVILGLIVSFVTGPTKPESLDPAFICPVFYMLCPFLPTSIRRKLRFGVGSDMAQPLRSSESENLDSDDGSDKTEIKTYNTFDESPPSKHKG